MRVAFVTYPSAFQNTGGGEILLLKLKEYLEKESVQVDFFDSWRGRVEDYDFIHVFGSVKDCLGLVRVANSRKVKVAITPLLWSDLRHAFFTEGSAAAKINFVLRHSAKVIFPVFPSSRRKLLVCSDLIFPNSQIELKQIHRLFAVAESKMRVVPNGVDRTFLDADPTLFQNQVMKDPFILGVGRIEPRKNQLNLIRAVKRLDKKLFLIGSPVSGYESYFEKCREEGKGFTTFLPTMKHEDPLLRSAYAACDLFVLQGWFETPGLAALEAALAGARVLVTRGGSTREYFEDFVDYLNPSSVKDIAAKIEKNLTRPKNTALKDHVLRHFTWEQTAKATARYYRECLGRS